MAKIDCKVKPIMTDQYPTPAQRPMNTLMSKDKITQVFSVAVVGWKISLNTCITLIQKEG
jgi:dTDP-4-dehydrorhamnose reductase